MVLGVVFDYLAVWLVEFEEHKFWSTYEASLLWKLFLFQSVASFWALFVTMALKPHAQHCR